MKQITLKNKQFAEDLVSFFQKENITASIKNADKDFVVEYDVKADADEGESMEEKLCCFADYILARQARMEQYFFNQLDSLWSAFYTHSDGHLPKLSASAMTKLLKTAGMDGDYNVVPKTIYASSTAIEFGAEQLSAALKKMGEEQEKTGGDEDVKRLMDVLKKDAKTS